MSGTPTTREELMAQVAIWRARMVSRKVSPTRIGDQAIELLPAVVALLDDTNPAHHLIVEHFRTRKNTHLPIVRLDAAQCLASAHNALLSIPGDVRVAVQVWSVVRRNLDLARRPDPQANYNSLQQAPKLLDQAIGCFHTELPVELVDRYVANPRPRRRASPEQYPLWEASVISQLLTIDQHLAGQLAASHG